MDNCDNVCSQLIETLVRFMDVVDTLWREGYVEEAHKIGLTGYVVASILSDAYMEYGLISPDFYYRFKRALTMFKDFVYSLGTSTTPMATINDIKTVFGEMVAVEAVARG